MFTDQALLRQALAHRSWCAEFPGNASNERLEFLGDAVLGLIISRWLFNLDPLASEGELTRRKSELVRWETLARLAAAFDLGPVLRMGKGEAASGGRERPLHLARAMEALIGAVYIDGGFTAARRWVERVFRAEVKSLTASGVDEDAKSRLQHAVQKRFGVPPRYRIVERSGPEHSPHFTVEVTVRDQPFGRGQGRTKQVAQQAAAAEALTALAEPDPARDA